MDQIKDIISISIFAVTLATIALSLAPIVLVIVSITLFKVRNIQGALKTIMATQAEFDAKVAALTAAVTAETAQVAEFIAGLPPEIDTSALDGFVGRINAIFEPVAEVVEEEPVPVEEPTEKEG